MIGRSIFALLLLAGYLLLLVLLTPLLIVLDLIDRITGRDKERREREKMMEEAHD